MSGARSLHRDWCQVQGIPNILVSGQQGMHSWCVTSKIENLDIGQTRYNALSTGLDWWVRSWLSNCIDTGILKLLLFSCSCSCCGIKVSDCICDEIHDADFICTYMNMSDRITKSSYLRVMYRNHWIDSPPVEGRDLSFISVYHSMYGSRWDGWLIWSIRDVCAAVIDWSTNLFVAGSISSRHPLQEPHIVCLPAWPWVTQSLFPTSSRLSRMLATALTYPPHRALRWQQNPRSRQAAEVIPPLS